MIEVTDASKNELEARLKSNEKWKMINLECAIVVL